MSASAKPRKPKTPNPLLADARRARGLTQQEFAEELEKHAWHEMSPPVLDFVCSKRKVQYWEGESVRPQVGSDGLEPIARRYLAQADALLEHARPDALGRELRSATGKLAASTGWFALDAENFASAQAYFGQALSHARLAADADLEACVCWCLARLALRRHRPHEAAGYSRMGLLITDRVSAPHVAALFEMCEAQALAQLGDRAAFEAAADTAWETFAWNSDEVRTWARFADEAEMFGVRATSYVQLGLPSQAVRSYEEAVCRSGTFRRNQAMRGVELANALLACGEVEGACQAASEALALGVASSYNRGALTEFARNLTRFDTEAARDFLARWRVHPQAPALG